MKWKSLYKAKKDTIGKTTDKDPVDIKGYNLKSSKGKGKSIDLAATTNLKSIGDDDFILAFSDEKDALESKDCDEFLGYGYIDALMRISLGISKASIEDVEELIGAHWQEKDEWRFGSVKDWRAAGNPDDVWFGPLRSIMGVDL